MLFNRKSTGERQRPAMAIVPPLGRVATKFGAQIDLEQAPQQASEAFEDMRTLGRARVGFELLRVAAPRLADAEALEASLVLTAQRRQDLAVGANPRKGFAVLEKPRSGDINDGALLNCKPLICGQRRFCLRGDCCSCEQWHGWRTGGENPRQSRGLRGLLRQWSVF
jgi:hypothetical protein